MRLPSAFVALSYFVATVAAERSGLSEKELLVSESAVSLNPVA